MIVQIGAGWLIIFLLLSAMTMSLLVVLLNQHREMRHVMRRESAKASRMQESLSEIVEHQHNQSKYLHDISLRTENREIYLLQEEDRTASGKIKLRKRNE